MIFVLQHDFCCIFELCIETKSFLFSLEVQSLKKLAFRNIQVMSNARFAGTLTVGVTADTEMLIVSRQLRSQFLSTIKKPSPIVQYFNIEFANANKNPAVTTG